MSNRGFTLIELIVVILILVVLVTVGVPSFI
ncbi:prepilin-type N-terminal cleavage/methylation domain-containing protein [Aeromonas caviae]|nr:prepilin-type N-terminal cleavage/methylation domain-containing protein [Aeromonas caviae]